MKTTIRQYWEAQVNNQLYMIGVGFPREHYKAHVLPKLKIDTLKEFYHRYHELSMMRDFNMGNANFYRTKNTSDADMAKVRKINVKVHRKKMKLVEELLG